ncbi:divergent PAP2 family protein [Sulfobacillus sp. hq2]|uniref:divergent PAP2 family protein n=1 Tax=Sulfobacillus TaxID=28033 RepID=UPI001FA83583|nr:divergent PAP2 family protein [Sulfobacillus sp. hq2]MCY0907885.1 divergent PAP2 family protein [Sulfobacillus thermotolerans]
MTSWLAHGNRILISALTAALSAQLLKFVLYAIGRRKAQYERLFGAGGMPSSHSAMVAALVFSIAFRYGWKSPDFAISSVFGLIVLYDALSVRRTVGLQSRYLNRLARSDDYPDGDKSLPEFVGHTPMEVIAGTLWGLLISRLFY